MAVGEGKTSRLPARTKRPTRLPWCPNAPPALLGSRSLSLVAGRSLTPAKTIGMPGGSDKLIVATNRKPNKVVVFDNAGLPTPAGFHDAAFAVRYAAAVDLSVTWSIDTPGQAPLTPAVDPIWTKGDQYTAPVFAGPGYPTLVIFTLWVTLPGTPIPLAGPVVGSAERGVRLQQVVVGNNFGNIRIVQFKQPIKLPITT